MHQADKERIAVLKNQQNKAATGGALVGAMPSALFTEVRVALTVFFSDRSGKCWKGEQLQPPLAEGRRNFAEAMQAVFARWVSRRTDRAF
ncbi:hypothetical protein [Mesorhizobium sangaii]|uniref:Uncharacterized protein n=1 Tax=Mesorhizobium sangaii TaxID=505389 RepID=A0A841PN81_9HYPH|nr:hypothetical protein [Mesorhizobium sangaii]MBB6414128.1 hypothetical protein [Mesorhizobium sangaii]